MNLTLEADYAIRIVNCLATTKKRLDAKTISEQSCVSLRFSLKILRKLVTQGIIKSYKGTLGGYELAKKPSEITLKEVIETIEGPYSFNRCLDENYYCNRVGNELCEFQKVFKEITEDVLKKLDHYNFEMFISKTRD